MAKGHSGRVMPVVFKRLSTVDRLLEQGHSRFFPQAMLQKNWAIGTDRQDDGGHKLRRIINTGEVLWIHPEMNLKGGIGPLQGDIRAGDREWLRSIDFNTKGALS